MSSISRLHGGPAERRSFLKLLAATPACASLAATHAATRAASRWRRTKQNAMGTVGRSGEGTPGWLLWLVVA